eukprot:8194000-Pyramimonas_sp.AAC.3
MNNTAELFGGGIYTASTPNLYMDANCTLEGNAAEGGGGIFLFYDPAANFANKTLELYGGIDLTNATTPTLTMNNTANFGPLMGTQMTRLQPQITVLYNISSSALVRPFNVRPHTLHPKLSTIK